MRPETKRKITIREIKEHIDNLQTFSELDESFYAPLDGAAHILAKNMPGLKMNQLRKFFGMIKKIKEKNVTGRKEDEDIDTREILRLIPLLSYSYGRNLIPQSFFDIMVRSLTPTKMSKVKDFKKFEYFIEAIIAYYKLEERKGGRR